MGFYYLIILLIGVTSLVLGLRSQSLNQKVILVVAGVLTITGSLLLFLPGSSEILAILFDIKSA